ncbi:hypothetical protein ACFQ1L_39890 [Phytohabitans flavus]|uniref:hypothetical protein n=1 Tax=Phytohabitans flavus TaxID=1076124 RepID=UPI00362CCD44
MLEGVLMSHLLTGPDAGDLLGVAVRPGRLLAWRARQVDQQPGRGCTAAYDVRVRWPDGRDTDERLAACTGRIPAGAAVLDDGQERVGVWRYPHDPDLPALATAADETAVAALLDGFDLGGGPVRLALRAYRPRRRAIIEAVGERGRLFLKVVRPDRVRRLHERHRMLVGAGVPAAPSLGHTPDGLLVLQALPGRTLREALRYGFPVLPPASAVLALLDQLPAELARGRRRRSWAEKAPHYAAVVGAALPSSAEQAAAIASAIRAEGGRGEIVPVHGDLYEAQLLVAGERVTGLLDIDTAGPGSASTTSPACSATCTCSPTSTRHGPQPSTGSVPGTSARSSGWWTRRTCATGSPRWCCRWRPARIAYRSRTGRPPPAAASPSPSAGWPAHGP